MIRKFLTSLAGKGQESAGRDGVEGTVGVTRVAERPRHAETWLLFQRCRSFVGQLERLGVLAPVVKLLRLVELGDCRLHLRIVRLHLGGGFPRLLDDLGTRTRERGATGERQRDRYGRNCHELSHALSPPS